MHATTLPAACENCRTVLQGVYCHVCGQSAANPLRSLHHAIEDVFESFWHLDGRVFRTLRELLRPGRVALAYLGGQRVRYIPPLRLFVVLSLLTFFIGKLAIGAIESPGGPGVVRGDAAIAAARTPAEVDARLEAALADIREGRRQLETVPAMDASLRRTEAALQAQAAARKATLAGNGAGAAAPAAAVATPDPDDVRDEFARTLQRNQGHLLRDPARPWHEVDNPLDFRWLPAIGDRWLNQRIANSIRNVDRVRRDPGHLLRSMLGAVPPALLVLVPVFALLLKMFYVRSRRLYLEHLVVALYSHTFLLLALLALFVIGLAEIPLADGGWARTVTSTLEALVWCSVPVYLLLMQKRVYAQRWPATLLKYLAIGALYLILLVGVIVYAAFVSITAG